jgi:hypothetical protein
MEDKRPRQPGSTKRWPAVACGALRREGRVGGGRGGGLGQEEVSLSNPGAVLTEEVLLGKVLGAQHWKQAEGERG